MTNNVLIIIGVIIAIIVVFLYINNKALECDYTCFKAKWGCNEMCNIVPQADYDKCKAACKQLDADCNKRCPGIKYD